MTNLSLAAPIPVLLLALAIWLGAGNGTFTGGTVIPAGSSLRGVACADFDRDGIVDLAVTSSATNTVLVLRGTFRPVTKVNIDMLKCARAAFAKAQGTSEGDIVEVAEITIDRREPHVRDLIERAQLRQHPLADEPRCDLRHPWRCHLI